MSKGARVFRWIGFRWSEEGGKEEKKDNESGTMNRHLDRIDLKQDWEGNERWAWA